MTTARTSRPASWEERLLVLTLGIVLVTVLTYPLIPRLGNAGRIDTAAGRFSVWQVSWVAHALGSDPRHLFDANIFSPHTGTLAYADPGLVAGVLGLPALLATHNPIAAMNSAVAIAAIPIRPMPAPTRTPSSAASQPIF